MVILKSGKTRQNKNPETKQIRKTIIVELCNTVPASLPITKNTILINTKITKSKILGTKTSKLFGILGRGPEADATGMILVLWHFGQR